MKETHISVIAKELEIKTGQVRAAATLLGDGATVPFIARYRKEATGSLDEVALAAIRDRLEQLDDLDKRREAILKSLEERGLLSEELRANIEQAGSVTALEDIYLPFRPKRRTRAAIAKEKGLEPLAATIFAQEQSDDLGSFAASFVDEGKGVSSVEEALAGARDIIAEWISEDQKAREALRELYWAKGVIRSRVIKGKEEEGIKYRDYYEWEEPVSKAPAHRVLAIRRGESEGVLLHRVLPPEEDALALLECLFIKGQKNGPASEHVRMAVHDSYKRLLGSSIEGEVRLAAKKRADEEAIRVFAGNIRQLLLAPPLGGKTVLAVDPGFRTGCKVVCLDRQGKLMRHCAIFPHFGEKGAAEAAGEIKKLCGQFAIEAIAIGNGTAGRETEAFVRGLGLPAEVNVVMVNESGASIYSASEAAREEFPEHDVTVRGSVSIGRRLMDPLAELVKIDPKSIGVGQYQHDVDQSALKKSLDDVVVSCVNGVGVEVNTASRQLLTYVSGLGPQLARAIVDYRNEHGPFTSREELKKVPRLGPKAFEQAAGFLRIRDGANPLDRSAVHPESYQIIYDMARELGCEAGELMQNGELRKKIDISHYVTDTVGMPTLSDIMSELARPGRDPRRQFEAIEFDSSITKIEDVKPGMRLTGIVTNLTAFGVFVDIGVHQDGLIHISELSPSGRFVKDPAQVVKVHQGVTVTVLDVDIQRKRIALSMRGGGQSRPEEKEERGKEKEKGKNPRADHGNKRAAGATNGRPEKKPVRFSNNPFYDAFRKKD
ncbi:MAG: Tex family protein [Nitrospiraceae bacterium]|nr:Tex family protein [Nitrospiraceae bacterium]